MSGKQNAKFLVPKKNVKYVWETKCKICYYKKGSVEQKEEFLMPKKLTGLKKNWEEKCKIPK
jgi:hypothetical protein